MISFDNFTLDVKYFWFILIVVIGIVYFLIKALFFSFCPKCKNIRLCPHIRNTKESKMLADNKIYKNVKDFVLICPKCGEVFENLLPFMREKR